MKHDRLSKINTEKGHYFNCATSNMMVIKK